MAFVRNKNFAACQNLDALFELHGFIDERKEKNEEPETIKISALIEFKIKLNLKLIFCSYCV